MSRFELSRFERCPTPALADNGSTAQNCSAFPEVMRLWEGVSPVPLLPLSQSGGLLEVRLITNHRKVENTRI